MHCTTSSCGSRSAAHLLAQVVPFSPAAGLLEWCEDTVPIGEYLLGGKDRDSGAHARYAVPGQISYHQAMKTMHGDSSGKTLRQRCARLEALNSSLFNIFFADAKDKLLGHWLTRLESSGIESLWSVLIRAELTGCGIQHTAIEFNCCCCFATHHR